MSSPLITAQTPGSVRNNFDGRLGCRFTVGGGADVNVLSVGRWVVSGNSQTHTVGLYLVSDGSLVASAVVDMSGATPGDYAYTALGSPATLLAGTGYYLASAETNGGDQWHDSGLVTMDAVATIVGSVYYDGSWHDFTGGESYVPVNLLFGTSPPPATTQPYYCRHLAGHPGGAA